MLKAWWATVYYWWRSRSWFRDGCCAALFLGRLWWERSHGGGSWPKRWCDRPSAKMNGEGRSGARLYEAFFSKWTLLEGRRNKSYFCRDMSRAIAPYVLEYLREQVGVGNGVFFYEIWSIAASFCISSLNMYNYWIEWRNESIHSAFIALPGTSWSKPKTLWFDSMGGNLRYEWWLRYLLKQSSRLTEKITWIRVWRIILP